MEKISSKDNKKIKHIMALMEKSKLRKSEGVFVAEGERMVMETPPEMITELYVSESYLGQGHPVLDFEDIVCVSDQIMAKMSDTRSPQGILAVVRQPHYEPGDVLGKGGDSAAPLVLLLEDVRDPGNLGTIVRTAEGAGVTGIAMTTGCVDIFSPKVIRSTMGAIYRMPIIFLDRIADFISTLRDNNCKVYAAHLGGEKVYDKLNYCEGAAFLLGNEANGLSGETAALADEFVIIPMHGKLESLNVAMAAGLLAYEADRQRRNA